jgi:hypothetical protein
VHDRTGLCSGVTTEYRDREDSACSGRHHRGNLSSARIDVFSHGGYRGRDTRYLPVAKDYTPSIGIPIDVESSLSDLGKSLFPRRLELCMTRSAVGINRSFVPEMTATIIALTLATVVLFVWQTK